MSSRARLLDYLHELGRRIRTHIYVRGAAIAGSALLTLTVLLVWWLRQDGFATLSAAVARIALVLALVAIGVWYVYRPLRQLRQHDGAFEFERRLPDQRGRVETFLDAQRHASESPLLELLARDALTRVGKFSARDVIPDSQLRIAAVVALTALAAIVWLLTAAPAFWGYGSRYLLLGQALPVDAVPSRQITVAPGNITVRRNSDLTIRATTSGFMPEHAQLFVRFDDKRDWERAPMQTVGDGDAREWQFKLYALRGPLHYYVAAGDGRGDERSSEHAVTIVDLPRIERVRLTYSYPEWTGLETQTEDVVRGIRAVAGTQVKVEVFSDAPLQAPVIVVDGAATTMDTQRDHSSGTIAVARPGRYHVGARVVDELVALTDDYPIEIVTDEKPSIEIRRPGRDARATSIEEVAVDVQAQDDFRLQQVALRYAVNGGDWKTMPLASGTSKVDTASLLRMEDLGAAQSSQAQLQPGDLVTYYAVAKDRQQSAQTDLFMVQVQPFERRFSEGQAGGAGGGMGDEQGAISERQREILLATWNLQRSDARASRSRAQLEESAKMLAELQKKLAAQAQTMAQRMRARTTTESNERVAQFVQSLENAVASMEPAAEHLDDFDLVAAVPDEQKALQQLLRAESVFRDVQVAMQRESSRGGQQSARNFTELFELEMDVDKNHYETQSPLSQGNDREELDETIRKLKELAERQERLAQQTKQQTPSREERWQQEQLRREAEDLRRRLEQLAQAQQGQGQPQQGQSQQGQSQQGQSQQGQSQQGNGEAEGNPSGSENRSAKALESMREALDNMRAANSNSDDRGRTQQSSADASRNLRQALRQMQQPDEKAMSQQVQEMAERAAQLSGEQRRVEADLYAGLGEAKQSARDRSELSSARKQRLIEAKQKMAEDVGALQRDMRGAINDHRRANPEATQRLAETLRDLETTNLSQRLNRSAAEIRYGRARDAAPREGLIADALEGLERDLHETARVAAREASGRQENPGPQELLAELGDMRRALQQAERGDPRRGNEPNGEAGEAASGGEQRSTARGGSLDHWDPQREPARNAQSGEINRASPAREAAEIAQRIDTMANRATGLELSPAEINTLRRMTREARKLSGDALASQLAAVSQLVDQLELAALAAVERSRNTPAAHTVVSTPDAPEYQEVVAEYYRRLGGSCTKDEGGRAC